MRVMPLLNPLALKWIVITHTTKRLITHSMPQPENLTPMMKQFYDLKAKNPDAILLFRCGDFYETYAKDAVTASQVLGITLTRRNNKGQTAATEMAGFPHHALDTYLPDRKSVV